MVTRYLLPLLALGSAAFAVTQLSNAGSQTPEVRPPVEPAASPFPTRLAGAGIIEPANKNIDVGSHVPGVVTDVYVQVGDRVRARQPLFQIDSRPFRAELAAREANLALAQAQLEKLKALPRPEEVPPAKAILAEAEANLDDQQTQYTRFQKLAGTAVAEEELDRRRMAVAVAKAKVDKARADLTLLEAGAWKADLAAAQASCELARAQLEQTRTDIERLTVRAPSEIRSGAGEAEDHEYRVLQVNIRSGEYVSNAVAPSDPPVILGQVDELHVRIDIDENDIPRFRENLPGVARPRGDSSRTFPIRFIRVEPYVVPKRSLTGSNTERVDTRVLQVVYAVETAGQSLYVGQQMDVFLDSTESQ